jgi:hypothetical protein
MAIVIVNCHCQLNCQLSLSLGTATATVVVYAFSLKVRNTLTGERRIAMNAENRDKLREIQAKSLNKAL